MKVVRSFLVAFFSIVIFYGHAETEQYPNLNITCVTPEITDYSTIYLFSHGLDPRKDTGIRQAKEYIQNGIITGMCYSFNYNDSIATVNLGQEDDYNRLVHVYTYICNLHPTADIILVGLSRGSVALLHFLASYDTDKLSTVKAVILESPFDTVDHVIDHVAQKYCWFVPKSGNLLKKIVSKLPSFKTYGLPPLAYAKQISMDIPFLITYSLEDKVVPAHATQAIIMALLQNKNNVTVVELEKGKHSTASFQKKFQDAARTFLFSHPIVAS